MGNKVELKYTLFYLEGLGEDAGGLALGGLGLLKGARERLELKGRRIKGVFGRRRPKIAGYDVYVFTIFLPSLEEGAVATQTFALLLAS